MRHHATARDSSTSQRERYRVPDFVQLEEAPQLAPVAVLQTALGVTATTLDLYNPDIGSVREVLFDEQHVELTLLCRLISDRCRELSGLLDCYRHALARQSPSEFDDIPF